MKVEAKGPFVAVRVCWENVSEIRRLASGRALVFSSTNVLNGSEDKDEERPFLSARLMWHSECYLEASHGEFIVFGEEGSINSFSKHEFQANFREIQE